MQRIFQSTKKLMYFCLMMLLMFTSAATILPNSAWAAVTAESQSSLVEVVVGFLGIIVGFLLGIFSQQ
ncbi:hypothetical protein [Calothrix sp. NIES-2098]|uniref:hypothetical protein n=1 Tax=Calothrix sp. NIES-2098 TaxID=1954171 RepID=UPI000B5DF43A|nr:hypothetical protein NIES2098_27940 [Calothrix sp. NIES-2098]